MPDAPAPDDAIINYDPEMATLTYALWTAQRDCLDALHYAVMGVAGR
ncbi:hypothetical protein ACFQGT_18270 [Natrialbaceae archaeon GCM10025810]